MSDDLIDVRLPIRTNMGKQLNSGQNHQSYSSTTFYIYVGNDEGLK